MTEGLTRQAQLFYVQDLSAPYAGAVDPALYRHVGSYALDGDDGPVERTLETLFARLNRGSGAEDDAFLDGQRLRSLSVGDVVVLGPTAYRCDFVGWTEMDATDPVARHVLRELRALTTDADAR